MRDTDCRKVNKVRINIDPMIFNQLQEFRQALYRAPRKMEKGVSQYEIVELK